MLFNNFIEVTVRGLPVAVNVEKIQSIEVSEGGCAIIIMQAPAIIYHTEDPYREVLLRLAELAASEVHLIEKLRHDINLDKKTLRDAFLNDILYDIPEE